MASAFSALMWHCGFSCFLSARTAGDEISAGAPFVPHLQIDLAADGSLHNCHGGTKKNPITVSIKDSALRVRWRRHIRLFRYINYGNSIMDTSKNFCLVMCQSENCIIFETFSIYPSFPLLFLFSSYPLPFFSSLLSLSWPSSSVTFRSPSCLVLMVFHTALMRTTNT